MAVPVLLEVHVWRVHLVPQPAPGHVAVVAPPGAPELSWSFGPEWSAEPPGLVADLLLGPKGRQRTPAEDAERARLKTKVPQPDIVIEIAVPDADGMAEMRARLSVDLERWRCVRSNCANTVVRLLTAGGLPKQRAPIVFPDQVVLFLLNRGGRGAQRKAA